MIKFGLTGGIACGKSNVTKTLLSLGVPMVDADMVARQIVEPGTVGLDTISFVFGKEYLQVDGTLDRPKLARLVFGDSHMRAVLDSIMFPLVVAESDKQLKKIEDDGASICGYDAALICEMGRADEFRPLIVVECRKDTQIERLMKRNNLTRAEAMARIEAQMSVEKKIALADFVINTDGTIQESIEQTKKIFEAIKNQSQ